jgi:hypothetical protein
MTTRIEGHVLTPLGFLRGVLTIEGDRIAAVSG